MRAPAPSRSRWWALAALAAAAALALGAASCGGDDEEETTAANGDTAAQEETTKPEEGRQGAGKRQRSRKGDRQAESGDSDGGAATREHEDSGGGAAQFVEPGHDNSIQTFGSEGERSEFEQAAAAVHGYLDARAAGEWAVACRYASSSLVEELRELFGRGDGSSGCPRLLGGLSASVPKILRKRAAIADVGSVRVEGDEAFVLYHGAENDDYLMPMDREDGEWKVSALTGSALP